MTITYRMSTDKVRDVCVDNEFYNAGTNSEYVDMFAMVRRNGGVKTADDILEIADDIYAHTNGNDDLTVESVMICLLNASLVLKVEM